MLVLTRWHSSKLVPACVPVTAQLETGLQARQSEMRAPVTEGTESLGQQKPSLELAQANASIASSDLRATQ